MKLTDEQRLTHHRNADAGVLALLTALKHDIEAISAHINRFDFAPDLIADVIDCLQVASEVISPTRETMDIAVTSYAMASCDRLTEDPDDDDFE
jgi:hypothetical protein